MPVLLVFSSSELGSAERSLTRIALADAIEYLAENHEVRKRMGSAGRVLAQKDFAIEKIVAQRLGIYQKLLDKAEL